MKFNPKMKLTMMIVNTGLCMMLLISVIYAWYVRTTHVGDMSFDILQIESLVTMYEANDSNFNGVPDLLAEANKDKYYKTPDGTTTTEYIAYNSMYHHEIYSFNYIDQKYALSSDSEANLMNKVTIDDAVPSKVYSYKFEIENYSNSVNTLNCLFDKNDSIDTTKLSNFETRLGVVNENNKVSFTNWVSFVNNGTFSGFGLDPISDDSVDGMLVPAKSTDINGKQINGRIDVWLQIRVKAESQTEVSKFYLPDFRISLSVESSKSEETE